MREETLTHLVPQVGNELNWVWTASGPGARVAVDLKWLWATRAVDFNWLWTSSKSGTHAMHNANFILH